MEKGSILKLKFYHRPLIYAILALLLAIPASGFSQEKTDGADKKPFDPKDAIFEHIGDAHSWPVFGKLSIPLPVILYNGKGIEIFSSAKIEDGHLYRGNYNYTLIGNKVKVVEEGGQIDEAASKKILDFSITRNVASMWLGMAVLLIVFLSVASAYKKTANRAPKGLQSFLEPLILFVRDDVAIPNIGTKHVKYMPLLLTVFFFILINNLFGLIPFFPGSYNLTGNIAVTLTLAVITLLVITFSGNKYYWKHIFMPDIPLWLYPIMVPVELIGVFSRPFALMIRLFANITAGHIIVLSLISLIFIFKTVWMSAVSVPFVIFMDTIELLVAFLQAYIFTMLSALFIGMAVEEHHH
jgi:F-type H+-transporting ATPase subunit a